VERIGPPEDIADVVVFLATERASNITGEEIVVDGDFTRTIRPSWALFRARAG
jgi:NAD(P)-dependent dehydrogenase (short-subunit alcohol dehydrogenase family)